MSAKVKIRIDEKSALPVVAAILSFMAVLFTLIDKYNILRYYHLSFSLISAIFPILAFLLFSIFALALSKKHVKLMLIPISLICLLQIINESAICYITIMPFNDYIDMMSHIYMLGLLLIIVECLLFFIVMVLGVLTFLGIVKSKIAFILVCVVNIFESIVLQVSFFISGESFTIPWYTLITVFSLISFILLAQGLQYGEVKYINPGMMNPPFPNPMPYPPGMPGMIAPTGTTGSMPQYQNWNQNTENPQIQYQNAGNSGLQYQQMKQQNQPQYPQQEIQPNIQYDHLQNYQQPDYGVNQDIQENLQQNTQQSTPQYPLPNSGVFDTIKQLYELNQKGIISNEEFETKKKELLSKI